MADRGDQRRPGARGRRAGALWSASTRFGAPRASGTLSSWPRSRPWGRRGRRTSSKRCRRPQDCLWPSGRPSGPASSSIESEDDLKQLIISRDPLETRVAVLEDGRLAEMYVERPHRRSLVGNVYKGRVENVLPGMDAAFVDIGLERNGFLSVAEVLSSESKGGRSRKIGELLKAGKELLVQVTRDPMGGKGPRLTMDVGIPGRYVVYLPSGKGRGCLKAALRRGARAAASGVPGGEARVRWGDRAHGRRGGRQGGPGARPPLPAEGLGGSGVAGKRTSRRPASSMPSRSWPSGVSATCWAQTIPPSSSTTRSCTGGW